MISKVRVTVGLQKAPNLSITSEFIDLWCVHVRIASSEGQVQRREFVGSNKKQQLQKAYNWIEKATILDWAPDFIAGLEQEWEPWLRQHEHHRHGFEKLMAAVIPNALPRSHVLQRLSYAKASEAKEVVTSTSVPAQRWSFWNWFK